MSNWEKIINLGVHFEHPKLTILSSKYVDLDTYNSWLGRVAGPTRGTSTNYVTLKGGQRFVTNHCKDIGICTVFCYKGEGRGVWKVGRPLGSSLFYKKKLASKLFKVVQINYDFWTPFLFFILEHLRSTDFNFNSSNYSKKNSLGFKKIKILRTQIT